MSDSAEFIPGDLVTDDEGARWIVWEEREKRVLLYNAHGAVTVKESWELFLVSRGPKQLNNL